MAESASVDERISTASPQARPRRRLGRRWIVAGILVTTAVGLALAYSSWWTKPTTFGGVGNMYGFKQTTDTMHPVTVDMVQRPVDAGAETITMDDVAPRVVTNAAEAVITFAVCRQDEESRFLSADGPAERSCESVDDVDGQPIRLTADALTTITMTVAPRRHGRVVIAGMNVSYARDAGHLWQRGGQATGPVVEVEVRK